ncbi:DUF6456 domain-containing protein [Roseovarius pelagicus]|uniref:DUF6456 domain-containing protein n=2 Tax=Roseovarius pelagicus TaxID=2980108 RepID=A0ABY6DBZ8_9RHOB|nr:DUF6456 domain-containing protein [Roseovarius pelagicus]
MQNWGRSLRGTKCVPSWVPDGALLYLLHTETGASIRALARGTGCHASTILRRIRRFETRRDDHLVDEALRTLGQRLAPCKKTGSSLKGKPMTKIAKDLGQVSEARLKTESQRILRRLCETGAVLAVASQMDKAVVVRDGATGEATRTAVVDREIAEAMALKGWIVCEQPGRIARYTITRKGRAAVGQMLAAGENHASGFADAKVTFVGRDASTPLTSDPEEARGRIRYGIAESPLVALSRRRDRDGERFVSEDLVSAGERLREDFELSQMGADAAQDWDRFLTCTDIDGAAEPAQTSGAIAARRRVQGALRDLGPGLGDIALRCCCQLEGLESAEKRMGWSARSGKIVLRIALQRLKRHYAMLGDAGGMIG